MAKKRLLLKDEHVESAKDRASSMETGIRDLASLDQVERGGNGALSHRGVLLPLMNPDRTRAIELAC